MTAEEVRKKLEEQGEKVNVVDVREDEEIAQGMIPGAKHIPLGSVEDRKNELDKEKEYIMVCRSGKRSGKATELLQEHGFNVLNMEGGMLSWEGKTE